MPRVIRDSDEEVETKSSARRTRASSAVSSVSVTDSPARRTTRSNKQLAIIESSPESLDDSNTQPRVRTTRSRTATLDKSATGVITKSTRSRKNSASSNLSETIDLESETTQKRVTRKAAATAAAVGTPTKTNLRSRNLRAGSEAKSTPPTTTRSTRVTRASSVDPINIPNESVGTPVKRRTRASIVPAQQTVTEEEEEAQTKAPLNNTVVEIDQDSETESVSTKGKSNKKVAKIKKEIEKDSSSTDQSNLDTSKTNEENMTDKSCTSNDSNEDSTLKALTTHTITSKLESFTLKKKENSEKIDQLAISDSLVLLTDQKLIKSDESHLNSNENNCDSVKSKVDINDDECELVDVEDITLTDDSIDVVDSPKKIDTRDTLTLDIKDSYVKLNRTNLVEKIVSEKLEENKNNDNNNLPEKLNDGDNVSQNIVITNAKTAIVLVNDFVKSNEYFEKKKDQQIFDSGTSLNNREDKNSNNSVHNSDDQSSVVSIDDNDKVLSLKLSSPNEKETQNDKLIVLPDDEKNYFDEVTDGYVSMSVNNVIVHNPSSGKADVCLKENASESKFKSENLFEEKIANLGSLDALNVVRDNVFEIAVEIGDELLSEKTSNLDSFEMINASDGGNVAISLHENAQDGNLVSMDVHDDAIVSVNVKSSIVDADLVATESKNEFAESSEIESACEFIKTSNNVGSGGNGNIEKNDSVNVNSIEAEQSNSRVTDTNEQSEVTDPSNSNEKRDIANPCCVFNETSSNEIEPKLSLEDKNAVPSAVTDADGDNASSPVKEEEKQHETSTETTSAKSPEKSKRKSRARVIDSDLDESAENLFQDIPAEEWSEEQSKRQSNEYKATNEIKNSSVKLDEDSFSKDKFVNGEDYGSKSNKKSRKSFDENELDKSLVEITNVANETGNQEADLLSLLKKARKSVEKKRESGQSTDSGIQDGNKTVVDNDAEENDHEMNESSSKTRLSLDRSLKANQSLSAQDKHASIAEKLPKSPVNRTSLNKSRKSLNNSSQFNASVLDNFQKKNDSLSASLNASNASRRQSSSSNSRKSVAEKKTDENSEAEAMDVDEADDSESELNKSNDSLSRSRKSPSKNDSIAEKSSVSLNASKIPKRLSLDKSLNKSSRKSTIQEEKIIDSEEVDVDYNESTNEAANIKSLSKRQSFFNESPSQNDGLSENLLSTSLNESKKSKKRLSEKFNDSINKSPLVKEQNEEEKSGDEELEVDVVSNKSLNKSRKSLVEPSSKKSLNKSEREAQVSLNNEDKSPRGKSKKKSANKSLNSSDVVVDDNSESEVEPNEDDEIKNKSSSKSIKTPSKSSIKASDVKDAENPEDSMNEGSPKKKKKKKKKGQEANSVPSVLDRSLQKSIELMKFANPSKHDISTVVQVNSNSEEDSDDSDGNRIPDFIFKLSDEDDTGEEEKEENDVDSDIEREYNFGGKSIIIYSDDEVPGDDCRVSEEESSDDEDDGADLQDFVIPDEEVEDDEDEDDDDGGDEAEDDGDEYEDVDVDESEDEYAKVNVSKENKINVSKKNLSVNSSQSTVKNASAHLQRSGFSQSSGSESDDEATEAENKHGKERFDESAKLQDSKTSKGKNTSLQKKHESIDTSSTKSHESSSSERNDKDIWNESQKEAKTDKSMNVSVKNNRSLNLSKSNKDKSASSSSKRNSSKGAVAPNDSKSDKNKSVRVKEGDETESSSSEADVYEASSKVKRSKGMQIGSPSEMESESEEGEDYYRVINVESRDASLIKPKKKKLLDCSTPKPGAAKKTDVSKDNLSMTASRRKSGSLNDLSNGKVMSSRQSIGEAASKSMRAGDTSMKLKDDVEIVATPETVGKTRQAWKLIPLNQTAHPAVEDTPGTKFLKKAKLNDSFPVLESMKSGDLSSASKKKSNGVAEPKQPAVELEAAKKSKKRKLLDMSNAPSVDEDSILKVSKNKKKRARLDDSTMPAAAEQEEQSESVEQSTKKKKSKQLHGEQLATDKETLEEISKNKKNKKKKKSQVNEAELDGVAAEDEVEEERPAKKRKKKLLIAQEAEEEGENAEPEKPRKNKSKVSEAKQVESQGSKSKKSKKQVADSSGDEAPESLGLEVARHLAFNEMRQEVEGARAAKESLKKKRKDQAERVRQDKQTRSLKRLPEDVLDSLAEEPLRRPDKRQKLSRNKERSVTMPSKSMFSPGKVTPENLRVDDGYIPLSSAGGTTQFAVINLRKAQRVAKKSTAALNFREKMLARNARMPTSAYLSYLKKQKVKSSK